MLMRFARVAAVLSVIAPAPAGAGTQAASTEPPRPATLAQLSWIAGHWVDDAGGDLSEEVWAPPNGDSMIGMWRYVSKGKLQIFELLSITEEVGGPVFRLRHFESADGGAGGEGQAPRPGAGVSQGPRGGVRRAGPADGNGAPHSPRPGADVLSVTLDKDGSSQTFQFRRQSP